MEVSRKPVAARPVPMPASVWKRAAAYYSTRTSAFRLLGDRPADDLNLPLRRHWVSALQVHCLSVRRQRGDRRVQRCFSVARYDRLLSGRRHASITFIAILSRYRGSGDEAEGERALSVILTVMVCVLSVAVVLGAMLAPLTCGFSCPGSRRRRLRCARK